MRTWKIAEAKAHWSELLEGCKSSPQLILNREQPVGVLVNKEYFDSLLSYEEKQNVPTMLSMFENLTAINYDETDDWLPAPRVNRSNPFTKKKSRK